jgi:predicted sugar kinase
MPYIKDSAREQVDDKIDELVEVLKGVDGRNKVVSYVLMKLMVETYDDDIEGLIQALGTMEETKLTLYSMLMKPIEERILLRRWLDGEWSRK